jgi:hypothetical protein
LPPNNIDATLRRFHNSDPLGSKLMIDLAIGLAGLCMVICSPIALMMRLRVNNLLVGRIFVLGFILIGGALGTIFYPESPFGTLHHNQTAQVGHVDAPAAQIESKTSLPSPGPFYGLRPIADLVPTVARNAFRQSAPSTAHLLEAWPRIVGPALTTATTPRGLTQGGR